VPVPQQAEMANEAIPTPQVPHRRARDILGLNRSHVTTVQRSLEIEVDNYLNDNNIGTDPLMFWQVGVIPKPQIVSYPC
jgi:hypothetical protein